MASSWERLANVTLGSDGSTLSSGTFTAKKHLRVVAWVNGNGSSSVGNLNMRLGNGTVDTGSNYGHIYSANGSSGVTQTSQTAIRVHDDAGNDNAGYFMEMVISNIASNEKLVQVHSIQVGSTGAGTAPIRGEVVGKWANTSDQINVISLIAGTSFLAGSVITVWGADDQGSTAKDKSSITNVPEGTRYEETDTRKIFRAKKGATYENDFTSNATGWTFVQDSSHNSSNGNIDFDFNQHHNDMFHYDLGSNASGTWVLTFKVNINTIGNPNASNYHMKFGMGDNTANAGTAQGGIFFYLNHGSGYQRFGGKSSYSQENQAGDLGSSSPTNYGYSADTDYYVKITRSSTTAATVHVYTNSDYTNGLVFTNTLSSVNASLTVRYLKFWTDAYGDQGSNRYHGTIDDVKFYDNQTTTSEIHSWVEKGTA